MRFEVFGAFWGTFDAGDAVRLHNLTHHGALIEAHQPFAVESVQSVCLMLDGQPAIADAKVRHHEPAASQDGERYLADADSFTYTDAEGRARLGYHGGSGASPVYAGFEDIFRGPESMIRDRLRPYVEVLRDRGPVVDLGCGRGEMLQLLAGCVKARRSR